MSIIFAKTRQDYGSYRDLWRFAELSGFKIGSIDDVDPDSDDTYIVAPMNDEIEELLPQWRKPGDRRAVIVWWFLERFDSMPMLTDGSYDRLRPYFDRVWASDRWMASQHPTLQYVILGSHSEFGSGRLPTEYDFTHQSYEWGRREPVYNRLRAMGLREGPNGWGDARDAVLRRSATMVHVQQYELPLYTPLRFAIAAAYKIPLVSEQLHDPYPLSDAEIAQAPIGVLPEKVQEVVRDPSTLGECLYETLCVKYSFRDQVEDAL